MEAKLLTQPAALPEADLVDWGPVPAPLGEPVSHTSGRLLHRDADGANETGVWVCTPGRWRCEVERDEFCQFLAGRCVYTADDGARLEIGGGDAAFFPAGWAGTCEVIETLRKTYMIR
jgi:uncharacterized cupin superfamily protein